MRETGSYIYIYVWTIDNPRQMEWLINVGVDGIITNKPQLLENVYNAIVIKSSRRRG